MAGARGIRAGRAFVELGVDDKTQAALLRTERRLKAMAASVGSLGAKLLKIGAGVAAGFGLATRTFAGFDDKMRAVRAVTGATEDQFRALTEEAKRLGRTTSFTAGQVADAMTELGRAGFQPTQILAATESVLALAKATSTELPRATEIAGAALRGFGLNANEMGRVADVLSATANKSAQTLEDLFEAFKPVAPIAFEAGETMEDVAAAIGILANNGIKGSLAGNALARAYKNLSTSAAQNSLKQFGVEAVDSAGNLRPLADIIADIGKATRGLGTAQKLSIFEDLFGRGQAAALKLASSTDAFDELRDQIRASAGNAVKTAEEMEAGIGGSFRRMFSAVEGVAIAVGNAIQAPLSKATEGLGRVAGYITRFVDKNQSLVVGLAKGTAVTLGAGVALIGLAGALFVGAKAFGVFASVWVAGTAAIATAKVALLAVLSPLGLVTAALVGLGAVGLTNTKVLSDALGLVGERFGTLFNIARETIGGIVNALKAGDLTAAADVLMAGVEAAWAAGMGGLRQLWIDFKSFMFRLFDDILVGAVKTFNDVKNARLIAEIATSRALLEFDQNLGVEEARKKKNRRGQTPEEQAQSLKAFEDALQTRADRLEGFDKKAALDLEVLGEKNNALIEGILAERAAAEKRRNETFAAERESIEQKAAEKLKNATDKLNDAIAKANESLNDTQEKINNAVPDDFAKKFQDLDSAFLGEDLGDRIRRQTAGIFNIAALRSLVGGKDTEATRAAKETATASKESLRVLRRMEQNSRRGGIVLA